MTEPAEPFALAGRPVVVAGAAVSGAAAARVLQRHGAEVTVVEADDARAQPLRDEGFRVVDVPVPPPGTDLVVTSPGWRPDSPLLAAAAAAGLEVVGEVELAWRLAHAPQAPRPPAPWLAVTGTNGKTTTVQMLEAVLAAAGARTVAAGNVGLPLVEAVEGAYDVLAVELSSFQLHWSSSLRPHAGALLNVADDHTDWHGSATDYALAKAKIFTAGTAVANADDEIARTLLRRALGRRVTFTLRAPRPGELGVAGGRLVDRAFAADAEEELVRVDELAVRGQHNVGNALAAAALARSWGVPAEAVREALRGFRAGAHRDERVALMDDVTYVDDSKATNPHAAAASLSAYAPVVWIAGGLLKGADVERLVAGVVPRLRAAVLLGTDRAAFAEALARHAPHLPVVEVERLDTGAMSEAVTAARALARPGDTVLLAPAAASMDCFRDYAERGRLFADAVSGAGAAG